MFQVRCNVRALTASERSLVFYHVLANVMLRATVSLCLSLFSGLGKLAFLLSIDH